VTLDHTINSLAPIIELRDETRSGLVEKSPPLFPAGARCSREAVPDEKSESGLDLFVRRSPPQDERLASLTDLG